MAEAAQGRVQSAIKVILCFTSSKFQGCIFAQNMFFAPPSRGVYLLKICYFPLPPGVYICSKYVFFPSPILENDILPVSEN